jgi:hypothetical protein
MTFVGTRLENKSLLSFPCLTSYIRFLALKLKKWIGVLQEYSIIHNFLFMRYSYWKIKIFYLFLVLIYIYIRFLALKLKKGIGVLQEYSIIHNFLFMRYSYWKIKIFYLFLVLIYIYICFLPLKLKKWFGVLQEYLIIHNILLYDIQISGVNCIMHVLIFEI